MATLAAICANALFAHTLFAVETGFYEPSFDCSGIREGRIKRGSIEYQICTDEDLARADRSLNFWYGLLALDSVAIDTKELRKDQRSWIQKRNKCSTNACIYNLYYERSKVLSRMFRDIEFADVQKPIEAELSECFEKDGGTVGLLRCIGDATHAWDKELENLHENIVTLLEHSYIPELVSLYDKLVLEHEKSYSTSEDILSTILSDRKGTVYSLILAQAYQDMRALRYRDLFLLREHLIYLFRK